MSDLILSSLLLATMLSVGALFAANNGVVRGIALASAGVFGMLFSFWFFWGQGQVFTMTIFGIFAVSGIIIAALEFHENQKTNELVNRLNISRAMSGN